MPDNLLLIYNAARWGDRDTSGISELFDSLENATFQLFGLTAPFVFDLIFKYNIS